MKATNKRRFDPAFKARVALAALEETETLAQIGQRFGVHPVLVGQWKRLLLRNAATAFTKEGARDSDADRDQLLKKIGELTIERDFLAKGLRRLR